ncbi:MAG: hypothetical protein KAT40_05050, partial [Bacteroidales bacterium]|nr:hypothetical protein [Bacteroidales bacterium]
MRHNNKISWNIFYNKPVVVLFIFFFWNLLLLNGQTYRIDTLDGQTVNTCAGTFYDSGGSSGYYVNNEDYTVTFCSDNGLTISLDFTTFEVRTGDTLRIYDGPDTSSPLLGSYTGEGITFTVTSSGTCLTLNFISDPSFNREGWVASILCDFCTPPVTSPISPSDNEVCAGEIINYSVDNHAGSTYTWTIVNGTPASLVDGPNNLDVTWSSTGGVTGSVKVIETNSCGAKDSSKLTNVDIYALPTVSFSGLGSDYCLDDSPVTLTGSPAGGTFSGPGMTGDVFDPSDAGAGTHNITYNYTDPVTGCSNQDIQSVDVHDLPTVSFSGLDPFYDITDSPVTLTGNPAGGTFSGPGMTGNVFDPAAAGYGLHEIVYEYTDINGCANSDTAYTEIRNYDVKAGAITLSDLNNWCSNDAEYTTTGATADELKGSCWNTGPNYNRWFRFQATTTEINIQVKIGGDDGTMRYPYVALWDGSNTELACARYSSQYSDLQIGSSSLTPGVWYYISVDNYASSGYQGTFTLCITDINDYDFKAGAIELTDLNNWCSADAAYTTISASADESKGTCWNTGPNYNRWFKFTATTNEALIRLKTGGSEGTMRYPYIAMWNEAGEQVACARYSYDYSDLTIGSDTLTIGKIYY